MNVQPSVASMDGMESSLDRIERHIRIIQWLLGANLALTVAIFVRVFTR
jgi:hypothetical protein